MPDGHDFRGVFYVRTIPEIRYEDGMFVVCHKIGTAEFEFVMRPNTFLKGLRLANEKAGEFHGRDVFAFKEGDEH
jgi:hypothetical protein